MKIFDWPRNVISRLTDIQEKLQKIQLSLGRIESRQILSEEGNLESSQYQVFSQWGEDGMLQYLINAVVIENEIFVEFGVQNYTESNTRFLLMEENWVGLLIEGSKEHVSYIKNDPIYWRYNLKVDNKFVTMENIDNILERNGISGDIGVLSIDVDGNDYWIWSGIETISPAIVIVEYNSRFGYKKAVTVPYNPSFIREKEHYSNIYYGASVRALCMLADSKGYEFVGANTAGNNAFFVRKDLMNDKLQKLSAAEGFVKSKFREARDESGELAFYDDVQEEEILSALPLEDVSQQYSEETN